METFSSLVERFKNADDNCKSAARHEHVKSVADARKTISQLKIELRSTSEKLEEVTGTLEEEAVLERMEQIKAGLNKAETRIKLLEAAAGKQTRKTENLRSIRRNLYQRVLSEIAREEVKHVPEEARIALARVFAVATGVDGGNLWDLLLSEALRLPARDREIMQLRNSVVAEYLPEGDSGDIE